MRYGGEMCNMLKIIKAEETYFMKTDFDFVISDFTEKLLVHNGMKKGSFAEDYVIRILTTLIAGAIDMREKYNRFYLEEYDSFGEYLYKKELLEKETIQDINLKANESLWMLRFTSNDYSIKSILGYDDENLQIINQTLEYIYNEN